MHSFTLLSTTLVMVLQMVNALTVVQPRALPAPADVAYVAHDEHTGNYLAYKRDGTFYGRYSKNELASIHGKRNSSNCVPLTLDDAKKMPGWNKIVDYANSQWGDKKRNIVVNPPEYLDANAIICTSDQPTPVEIQGDQSANCVKTQEETKGELVGTNGTVTLTLSQGYINSASWSVARTSSFGIGTSISATLGIPEVLEIGAEVTTTANVENSLTNGFDTKVDNTVSQSVEIDSADGETCYASISTETCNVSAKARLQQTATGYIWFNYDSRVDGHYKWPVSIEAVTSLEERSSYIDITGSMRAISKSSYAAHCE
ncbi:hypothetical protein BD779DRAFT_1676199 [Infundibulicybe gibba]|nr:hypothetical protein BD779DRAFT_1676199 [Infundibulicybe gibba]